MSKEMSFEEILEKDGVLTYTNKGVSMKPLLREDRDVMVIKKRRPKIAAALMPFCTNGRA